MQGSVNHQINKIFVESGIFQPGTSRHEEKLEIKDQLSQAGASRSSQDVADKSVIHSYETAKDYKSTWHDLGHFCRQECRLKDMTTITPDHVQAYLEKRISDGVSFDTWGKEAAHVAKFGNALEKFDGVERNFRESTGDIREIARDTLRQSTKDHGGFVRPEAVIGALSERAGLAGKIQLEGGARLREACLVSSRQLQGVVRDPVTGEEKGRIHLTDTKGGKPRDIHVSKAVYKQLEKTIQAEGRFQISQSAYRTEVYKAAKELSEKRTGTHDFRYNYAQERYNEVVRGGSTHEQALQQVSWEMGHERADITEIYLR
jgi:hypothetical protein